MSDQDLANTQQLKHFPVQIWKWFICTRTIPVNVPLSSLGWNLLPYEYDDGWLGTLNVCAPVSLEEWTAVTCEHFTCSASAKCEFAGRRMDIWISSSKIFRGREGEEQIPSPSHTPSTINCKTYTIWIMCGHILFSYMFNTFIITLLVDRMLPTSAQEVVYLLHYTDYSRMPLYIANIYELVALAYL